MRIIFYLPNLRPGGAERVMLNLLHYFYSNNVDVSLLLGVKEGELLEQVEPSIPVYELGSFAAKGAVLPLIKFCKAHQPDILFTSLGASVAAAFAKRFLPKKTILITRLASIVGAEINLFNSILKKNLFKIYNLIIAKKSDIIICQCEYMKLDLLDFTGVEASKVKVINNPINIDKVLEGASVLEPFSADLIAVGRLVEVKNYISLLDTLQYLKEKGLILKLTIVGVGILEGNLKDKVWKLGLENQVSFLGYQPNPYKFISTAKLLVSSSLYEGFSNVIIESLILGVPVVATDCPGGNREIILPELNGYIANYGDPKDLAEKISLALANYGKFNKTAIANTAREKYNIERIGKEYFDVFSGRKRN